VDDVAGDRAMRPDPVDHRGVLALGHEADVLAVGLVGDRQAQLGGDATHLALGHPAQREAQEVQLVARGGEQEIALVLGRIGRAAQLRPVARRMLRCT
jgi:hypothetical protein